jgi:hypothetical protein
MKRWKFPLALVLVIAASFWLHDIGHPERAIPMFMLAVAGGLTERASREWSG